jgi:ABC-type uncharacterized transport system fused permease/ATPase subunit
MIHSSYDSDHKVNVEFLSPGEQQRLLLLRLLYHKPEIAFLDESTCYLDDDMERRLLTRLVDSGIHVVLITHGDRWRSLVALGSTCTCIEEYVMQRSDRTVTMTAIK